MNPGDSRRAPEGKFRVVGYDQYDYTDYVVGDFTTRQEAVRVARAKAAVPNGIPTSFSDLFFVYDDRGICLEQVMNTLRYFHRAPPFWIFLNVIVGSPYLQ
jgi:hypothetical protein